MGVAGVQILCEPAGGAPPLPPADRVRAWRRELAVTVHPTFYGEGFAFTSELDRAFAHLRAWIDETGVRDVVIHANHFARGAADIDAVRTRLGTGTRLLIENVGARANTGRTLEDVRALLEIDRTAAAILDIAHLEEIDGPSRDVRGWIDDEVLGPRLAMIHVSRSGIARPALRPAPPSAIATADHLPTFLADSDAPDIRAALARLPLVIEGCLPPGPEGREWLQREIAFLASW